MRMQRQRHPYHCSSRCFIDVDHDHRHSHCDNFAVAHHACLQWTTASSMTSSPNLLASIFERTASLFLQPNQNYIHLREFHPGVGIVFAWERCPDNIAINIHPSRLKNYYISSYELGLLCPGTTQQSLASCVQLSPWSLDSPVISPSIVSEGVLEYCRMLGTKLEYADFQFEMFKLLLYETA